MTARLDITLKTTEHNQIARTGKYETEGIVQLKLTTDRYEASRGLFATAELLVSLESVTQ